MKAPFALVALLLSENQWFASSDSLPVRHATNLNVLKEDLDHRELEEGQGMMSRGIQNAPSGDSASSLDGFPPKTGISVSSEDKSAEGTGVSGPSESKSTQGSGISVSSEDKLTEGTGVSGPSESKSTQGSGISVSSEDKSAEGTGDSGDSSSGDSGDSPSSDFDADAKKQSFLAKKAELKVKKEAYEAKKEAFEAKKVFGKKGRSVGAPLPAKDPFAGMSWEDLNKRQKIAKIAYLKRFRLRMNGKRPWTPAQIAARKKLRDARRKLTVGPTISCKPSVPQTHPPTFAPTKSGPPVPATPLPTWSPTVSSLPTWSPTA